MAASLLTCYFPLFCLFLFLLLGGGVGLLYPPSLFERGVLEAGQGRTGRDRTGRHIWPEIASRQLRISFFFLPFFLPLTLFPFLYGSKLRDIRLRCVVDWDRHSMAHGARGVIEMGLMGCGDEEEEGGWVACSAVRCDAFCCYADVWSVGWWLVGAGALGSGAGVPCLVFFLFFSLCASTPTATLLRFVASRWFLLLLFAVCAPA